MKSVTTAGSILILCVAVSAFWSDARTRLISSRLEVATAPEPRRADEHSELFGRWTQFALGTIGLSAFAWATLRWHRRRASP